MVGLPVGPASVPVRGPRSATELALPRLLLLLQLHSSLAAAEELRA